MIFLMSMKLAMLVIIYTYKEDMGEGKLPQGKSAQEKQKESMSSICLMTANKGKIGYLVSCNGLFSRWYKFIQFQSHLTKHVWHIFMKELNQTI